ncbi:MAG: CCDC90 family protein [Candidatus Protistobacter heckmanni]|nr:CCDC90 family protein [Candidatus Protistobacter heckmanni]
MENRITALEIRFETVLPTLATKADLHEVRSEIHAVETRLETVLLTLATKVDLQEVRIEIQEVRTEIQEVRIEIQEVRTEMQEVRTEVQEVRTEIHGTKAWLIRWVVSTALALCAATLSYVFKPPQPVVIQIPSAAQAAAGLDHPGR